MCWNGDGPAAPRFGKPPSDRATEATGREVTGREATGQTVVGGSGERSGHLQQQLFPELDIDATLALAELARQSVRRNRHLSAAEVFTTVEGDGEDGAETGAPRSAVLVAALANLYEYTRLLADEMSTRTAGRLEERSGEELSSTSHLSGYCLGCPTTWRGSGPMVIERARLHGRHHGHTTVVDSSRTHVFQYGQGILMEGDDEEAPEPPLVMVQNGG